MQKKEDIPEFEKLEQQLHSFLQEISTLSAKKPNEPLNKFKLKFINSTLDGLNRLVADHRPFKDFETFNVDDLASNSDVVLILAQYAASTQCFRLEHTEYDRDDRTWYWVVRGKVTDIAAGDPQDFKYQPK